MYHSQTSPTSPRFPQYEGFHQLPRSAGSMAPPGQIGEDIPLEKVVTGGSTTGARKPSSTLGNTAVNSPESSVKRPRIGRRKTNSDMGRKTPEEETALTRMGRIYSAILNFSIVTRYFIYVLPVAAILAIPIILGFTAYPDTRAGGVRMVWLFAWIEIVWLGLWVSKIFAHFLPKLFAFLAGVVSPGVRKYYLILRALQMPISFLGWALISLCTFSPIMTKNPDTSEDAKKDTSLNSLRPGFQTIMNQVLGAFLVCSIVWLAEKFLIQLISIDYHRKQFDDKISDNKRSVYLLGQLYEASRQLFPEYCKEFQQEDYVINDALNLSALGQSKRGSMNPLKVLQNVGHGVGRVGDKVGAAFGQVAQEITGNKSFDQSSSHAIVNEALGKTRSCEALARRLWLSFVIEGRDALYLDDVVEVLGNDRREEAEEAFSSIDRDGNGDISMEEMILTVTEVGRTRKTIASSMHDVDQAIGVLDSLLSTVALLVCIFVIVAFVNKNFTASLATTGTAILSLSFVFAATCQEVLGSCIFLFVKHPFDIGDRVDITSESLVVERISLLYSVFKRVDTGKTVQIPNIVLNSLWIDNITRSKAMRERIAVFVNFDTSFDDIRSLKEELITFVSDKENSRDFHPEIEIEVSGIAEMNKMELKVEVKHKSNWSNDAVRSARRSKFMCALVLALRRVPIYGPGSGDASLGSIGAPSYSVALTPEQAQKGKDDFADGKLKKRLHPVKPAEPIPTSPRSPNSPVMKGAGAAEYLAISSLNSRNPLSDPARDDTWQARDDLSTLDERTSVDYRGDDRSERGLLSREPSGGRRQPNQAGGQSYYTSDVSLPRQPSSVTYASPPGVAPAGPAPTVRPPQPPGYGTGNGSSNYFSQH